MNFRATISDFLTEINFPAAVLFSPNLCHLQQPDSASTFAKEIPMKINSGLLLSIALLSGISSTAFAAATEEGAKHLTKVLQSYLTDTEGVVDVSADGDVYKVKLDVAPLTGSKDGSAAPNPTDAPKFTLAPIELELTDEGDGKWQVKHTGPIEFSVENKDELSLNGKFEAYEMTGVFDEKLATFSTSKTEIKNFTVDEKMNDPAQGPQSAKIAVVSITQDQTAAANAAGGVDITNKLTLEGLSENIASAASADGSKPAVNGSMTADSGIYETAAKNAKVKSILDLVAFFVSHQSKEKIIKSQADLKTILAAVLPVFDNAASTGTFKKVSVLSPVGQFGFDAASATVDMNGAVKDGKFHEKLSLSGPSFPAGLVPAWATKLVPQAFTVDFTVSGFDVAAPAQIALDKMDLTKDNPWPDNFEQVLLPVFMPKGTVDITMNPTSVSNDTYNVKAEGSMTAGPAAMPTGQATVTAKGLDDIMKLVQAAPPEAGLQSGTAMIIAAKGLSKTEADGSLSWKIEAAAGGKISVNGTDLSTIK